MSLSERLGTSLRQMWLRIRYAEHVGTRLTPQGFRLHLPGVFLQFGGAALFGAFLGAGVVEKNVPLALVAATFVVLFLLSGVTVVRMLVGYRRTDRYPVVLDLWSDSGQEPWQEAGGSPASRAVLWSEPSRQPARRPLSDRTGDALWVAFIWLCSFFMWAVAVLLLYGLVVGDFPGGDASLGAAKAE